MQNESYGSHVSLPEVIHAGSQQKPLCVSQQGVRGQAAQQGNKAASLIPADRRLAAKTPPQRDASASSVCYARAAHNLAESFLD